MSRGIDNHIDWAVAATPLNEQYGPGLARKAPGSAGTAQRAASKASNVPLTKRGVMDKLLGENTLAAFDAGGDDPYNATGKQFRR